MRVGVVLVVLIVILNFIAFVFAQDNLGYIELIPNNATENHSPLDSLEGLLRDQAELLDSFEDLLNETPRTTEENVQFLASFEDLLRRQAILFSSFEDFLKAKWLDMNQDEQEKFLMSFEDLLQRQIILFSSFKTLLNDGWTDLNPDEKCRFLDSYEDLLRRQSNLLKSFEELYLMTYGGLYIEKSADQSTIKAGGIVNYTYTVRNWYKVPIINITITDDKLGLIAEDISLEPGETKYFVRSASLQGTTCNVAEVVGYDPDGREVRFKSNVVCVRVIQKSMNFDSLIVGDQKAQSSGGDPPLAENRLEIEKNQKLTPSEYFAMYNIENMKIGNQSSSSQGEGRAANTAIIKTNQS